MCKGIKVRQVSFGADKPVKDTTGTRPVYVKPISYILENGVTVSGLSKSQRLKDVEGNILDLQHAAARGTLSVTLNEDGTLRCVTRSYSLSG